MLLTPPTLNLCVHQSGINALAIRATSTGTPSLSYHTLVSVGDDNALALTYLAVSTTTEEQEGVSVYVARNHIFPSAHSSGITGTGNSVIIIEA